MTPAASCSRTRTSQNAVADFLVNELFANVDVEAKLEQELPPQLSRSLGPRPAGIRGWRALAARDALQRPEVQQLWENANRTAHEQLLAVINGDAPAVSTERGAVTLDLAAILEQLAPTSGSRAASPTSCRPASPRSR